MLANYSCLCTNSEESFNHLLIYCGKVRGPWNLLFYLFDFSQVLPFSVKILQQEWRGSFVSKNRKKIWRTATLCLFWILWQERNKKYFDGIQHSDRALKGTLICTLFHWTGQHIQDGPSSLLDSFDWLLCQLIRGCYVCHSEVLLFFSFFFFWASFVYLPCTRGAPLLSLFGIFNIFLVAYKKK